MAYSILGTYMKLKQNDEVNLVSGKQYLNRQAKNLKTLLLYITELAASPLASREKKWGEFFCFWVGWGCPTPQENSLKPPQEQ